jgi:hypothetical protein
MGASTRLEFHFSFDDRMKVKIMKCPEDGIYKLTEHPDHTVDLVFHTYVKTEFVRYQRNERIELNS